MLRYSRKLAVALVALAISAAISPVFAATGEWAEEEHVGIRLIATHAEPGKPLEGVIEIVLDPGWKTYWRAPGDAGIPPRFEFSGSDNAPSPVIEFPAPEREDDGVSVSNVYHNRVLLPVTFAAGDPGKPAALRLSADLGICKDICLPVNLVASLDVPAGESDADAAATIAAARAALPKPGEAGLFEVTGLRRIGGTDREPQFEATVVTKEARDGLLFVETPPDWYPAAPLPAEGNGGPTRYRFTADRSAATTPLDGATVRLTLTENGAATTRAFKLAADGTATPLPD